MEAKLYTTNTANKNWFGGSATTTDCYVFNAYGKNQLEYKYADGTWITKQTTDDLVNKEFTVEYGDGSIKINSLEITTLPTNSFADTKTITIFVRNGNSLNGYIDGRLYYFKIYENGTLIRDFIPCYRKNDNVIGLYDAVNDVFYLNQGTNNFIKGSNMDSTVTSNTLVSNGKDHTLYAIWQ